MKLKRDEIIKALECCSIHKICTDCPYFEKYCKVGSLHQLEVDALELIKELTEEVEQRIEDYQDSQRRWEIAYDELEREKHDIERTLIGVMFSVDKWLDGAELEQDEVKRAITMREKTLQIVEKLKGENEKLIDDNRWCSKRILETDKIIYELRKNTDEIAKVLPMAKTAGVLFSTSITPLQPRQSA